MKLFFAYCKETNDFKLVTEDNILSDETIDELNTELNDLKECFKSDLEVEMTIDELNKSIVTRSVVTNHIFRCSCKYLDVDEICYCIHEVAVMDNNIKYLEIFSTGRPSDLSKVRSSRNK